MKRFNKEDLVQARSIDMVRYLSKFGIEPSHVRGNDFWYRSPFREEKTASFKVDRTKNLWYDFGEGRGGNIIDFAMQFHRCTIMEFMESLHATALIANPKDGQLRGVVPEKEVIQINRVRPLYSYPLLNYLKERKIDIKIADQHCRELHYTFKGKGYYAIGFQNDLGGYEVRNQHFKSSTAPKSFKSMINGAKELCVFEGFTDFLSFRTLHQHLAFESFDYLVLNSLSFFEQARPLMESYAQTNLYLDQDKQGRKFTAIALSSNSCYKDQSALYTNYKDLNDFLINFGKNGPDQGRPLTRERKLKKGI